jgi:GNAT superfamily N-acetyltransferase
MTRIYPDTVAGPFPTPPRTVVDETGRRIEYGLAGADDTAAVLEMYDRFDPDDRAQGLPPVKADGRREWVETLLADTPLNVVARDDGRVVGHAALVPEGHEAVESIGFARGAEVPEVGERGSALDDDAASAESPDDADGLGTDPCELAIFVVGPYQHAGIGTELLKTLLGAGRERGVSRVWLTVERWNEPAVALYRSVGFETSDAEVFELEMSLRLS